MRICSSSPAVPATLPATTTTTTTTTTTAALPLLALAIGCVMAMLDVTVVNVALPTIADQLDTPLSGLVWIVDGYTLAFAALLLAAGALSDRYGAKPVYLAGLAVFTLASLLCGAAPDTGLLVAARLLQGVGAALFMPSSLSLLMHAYQAPSVRSRMVAAWSAIITVAATAGPLAGGVLISQFGWRSIFLINLPLGLAGLWLAHVYLASPAVRPRPLNLASHLLGIAMLGCASYALIQGNVYGWMSPRILAASVLAMLFGAALVMRERRHAHPIVPRTLSRTPGYVATNTFGFLISFSVYGLIFLLSLYVQQALGADALQAGLQLLPVFGVFSIGNLAAGRLTARWGAPATMLAGAAIAALASMGICVFYTPEASYLLLVAMLAVGNLATGAAIPAMTALALQLGGPAHANSAAATLNANRQAGALVGVAAIGSVLHALPDWHASLPAAMALIAAAYAANVVIAIRYIPRGTGQESAAP
ncbi:MFS transporter [Bordetella sp. BOR01]|uniref:MFS transporter n=1 Tax=Bordetella sp. BOR01 TaxID=2854779 RepID=UPI001C47E5E8|nr:MFS transporter [Bordetella sp. BOR01]MBV7486981.1 MFS transporter [Bordetella sp. BOR01]